jgi:hypothetical protein
MIGSMNPSPITVQTSQCDTLSCKLCNIVSPYFCPAETDFSYSSSVFSEMECLLSLYRSFFLFFLLLQAVDPASSTPFFVVSNWFYSDRFVLYPYECFFTCMSTVVRNALSSRNQLITSPGWNVVIKMGSSHCLPL